MGRGAFLAAFLKAGVLLLAGVLVPKAQLLGLQAESADPPRSLPAKEASAFEDKATGSWLGQRQRLERAGITIDASITLEGFNNFRGGLRTDSTVGASTFDLSLSLDTGKLLDWPGGTFYVDLEDHAGEDPSADLVGDLQIFDQLNADPYLQIFELWVQQTLFGEKLRLKIGKVDANTEFSAIENGWDFLNSSSQVSPTVFLLPTTPAPMPSVNLFFKPNQWWFASFGAYYSNRSVGFGNLVGHPQNAQLSHNGAFLIGETGLQWRGLRTFAKDGNLKLGTWGHTGTFTRFDGSQEQGVYGYYAFINQTLWQPFGEPGDGRGVRAFLEYGRTQSNVNAIDWHTGGGVAWTGMLVSRQRDVVGIGPQYAHISPEAGLPKSYELAIETFYRLEVSRWLTVMPDVQYILNPGGQYSNALVGTIRMNVSF